MSADDGIRLRELPGVNGGSYWVAYHYVGESFRSDESLSNAAHYERYQTLEQVTQAYRDAAAETEYGFDISYQPETLKAVTEDWVAREQEVMNNGDPRDLTIGEETGVRSFGQELTSLINRYSKENASGTPDFILARYLERQLWIFEETTQARASWRGEVVEFDPSSKFKERVDATLGQTAMWVDVEPSELRPGDIFRAFPIPDGSFRFTGRDDQTEYVFHHLDNVDVWYGDGHSGFMLGHWTYMKKVVHA